MSIYNYSILASDGKHVSMEQYRGKVLLIVNTATGCGFTPQYEGLEKMYKEFKNKGFEVLDFPCNQFGHQAPGTDKEISEFCQLNYQTTFQTFSKIKVNGEDTSPLYVYLKNALSGLVGKNIKWNFTKFLVNRDGQVIKRYAPITKIEDIQKDIEKLL
ncbi:glutathione peroxidase [Vagococcus vulneris]|uniref:Glutathione peroxidase n=1 Tax=Vagococcus vulneris TaxID=1977869 RepID=A0A429ZYW5_9ENTE|nr:glutathione peroxidase [Vagococcus vulneris]RST99174.1 glutathione peroxidase [Vagococcus vulneris]